MAAASEAPMRIVPSYVSSNGYYGYVPPINEPAKHHNNYQDIQQQQHRHQPAAAVAADVCITNNHSYNGVADYHLHNQQHYDYNNSLSAMDTDDYGFNNEATHCQNNHCVIPETARRLDDYYGGGGVDFIYRVTHSNDVSPSSIATKRANRKRNSYDDHPDLLRGQMKKFRQGGGNKRVCHGTGTTREDGSTAMHNKPTTLCLIFNSTSTSPKKRCTSSSSGGLPVNNCCNQNAAGNYHLMNDDKPGQNHNIINSNNNNKNNNNDVRENTITNMYNVDIETMLMETHGCSAYHHHHHHLFGNGPFETEF